MHLDGRADDGMGNLILLHILCASFAFFVVEPQ